MDSSVNDIRKKIIEDIRPWGGFKQYAQNEKCSVKIITVNSKEVAWLFGVEMTTVEAWVAAGTLTPCSSTPDGYKRFWREDIAELLASYGA